jgi:hypothetical protein
MSCPAWIRSILILVATSKPVLPEHNLTEIAMGFPDAKEIYKHAYKLNINNMVPGRIGLLLFLYFSSLTFIGAGGGNLLINGTNIYLATGDSYGLYQGYIITLKSASSEGFVWLELADNDKIVKSEIVYTPGEFVYNKTIDNSTNWMILSVKVDKVYSGSSEKNLISMRIYQFGDIDKPFINITSFPENNVPSENSSSSPVYKPPQEELIWVLGIILVIILFYVLRKFW